MLGTLIGLLVAEKSGFAISDQEESTRMKVFADRMTEQVLSNMEAVAKAAAEEAVAATAPKA